MIVDRISAVEIDKKTATRYATIVSSEFFAKPVTKVKCLGGGSFGLAFCVTAEDGRQIVVKLLRAGNMLEKETHDLKLLSCYSPVKMPQVLFVRKADKTIPVDCYGMSKIEGKTLLASYTTFFSFKSKRMQIGERVVDALHCIHKCTNAKFGDTMKPIYNTWNECYKPFALQIIEKAREFCKKGELDRKIVDVMELAWQKYDVIFEESPKEACLIHGDLNIMNIMRTKRGEIAFIDPLNCMYADREYDLFQFYNLFGGRYFLGDIYREKYGESRRCEDKLAFYALWNEVFCFIKSGVLVPFIMNPLVAKLQKRLENL